MRKETKGNNTRSHAMWLSEKGPKLRSVAALLSKAEWIDETVRCERSGTSFGEKSSNYWLWNVLRVWFFLKHRCNHRSKQIETVWFHHISCGSWTEQVCTPFAQRRHHVSTCACLIELKTELKTENLKWQFLCSSETRSLLWGRSEFTTLLC